MIKYFVISFNQQDAIYIVFLSHPADKRKLNDILESINKFQQVYQWQVIYNRKYLMAIRITFADL
jgi:hypothetical protein